MKSELMDRQAKITIGQPANKTLETIYSRRAVRKYKDQIVEKQLIEQIIDAGRMAPTAMNIQPWKFYVLTDKELIKTFAKQIGKASIKGFAKTGIKGIAKTLVSALLHPHDLSFFKDEDFIFHGAPVVIFISGPKGDDWAALDIGACAENMMLAAKSLGLDSCPIGLAKFVEETKIYSRLNVSVHDHVFLAVILGYGNQDPETPKRKKDNLFYID